MAAGSALALAMVLSMKDKASKTAGKAGKALGKLGKLAGGVALGAVAAGGAMAGMALKMASDSAKIDQTRQTFDKLAISIGSDGPAALALLGDATRGMVADSDLMLAGNKFMAMGLSNTAKETAKLAEMATQLGLAMGEDAAPSMENFALMLANQSIPRLDSFGISSSVVRERILELMKADEDMTRETAFMTAVMEQGSATMKKVGEQGDTLAAKTAKAQAKFANFKDTLGRAFMPILNEVMTGLGDLAKKYGPMVIKFVQKVTDWLTGKLIPAFKTIVSDVKDIILGFKLWGEGDFASFMELLQSAIHGIANALGISSETIRPFVDKLYDLGFVIRDMVIQAFEDLTNYWEATLLPALQDVWAFLETNFVPILAGLGAILLVTVVPAFIAWAVAAITAGAATVAALAPVLIPLALIGAAVGLLVAAWQNDWGGIQAKVTEVWEGTLKPAFEGIKEWLEINIPIAMAKITEFWEGTLLPAFKTMAAWLEVNIPAAIEAVVGYWEGTLLPALTLVWEVIQTDILPIFTELAEIFDIAMTLATTALAGLWQNTLEPALKSVWEFIQDKVMPIFITLRDWIVDKVTPSVMELDNKLSPLQEALEGIRDAAAWVIGKLKILKEWLDKVKIPDALLPGSPSPLELSLVGIANGFVMATAKAVKFEKSLQGVNDVTADIEATTKLIPSIAELFAREFGTDALTGGKRAMGTTDIGMMGDKAAAGTTEITGGPSWSDHVIMPPRDTSGIIGVVQFMYDGDLLGELSLRTDGAEEVSIDMTAMLTSKG